MHMCVYMSVYACVCSVQCICTGMLVQLYDLYVYRCVYLYIFMYVFMCTCICVVKVCVCYVYVYVYMCMYV